MTAAKVIPVYELTEDNTIYVFATVEALTEFSAGKPQPTVLVTPELAPRRVVIEAADAAQADQILAGYNNLHPAPK